MDDDEFKKKILAMTDSELEQYLNELEDIAQRCRTGLFILRKKNEQA